MASAMPQEMLELFAYEFESDLRLDAMLERVKNVTEWSWLRRDSDRFGEYLSAATRKVARGDYDPALSSMVKLIELGGGKFALNVRYSSRLPDARSDFDGLDRELRERVLPALDARSVRRAEDYE